MAELEESGWFEGADAYEHYIGRWSRPVAHMFLDWLSTGLRLNWVDVGCGTGALTGVLLDGADPLRVIGVEPSQAFLNLARAKVTDARAEFRLGDAQALPVYDSEADAVVSGLVLNFLEDKPRAIKEMCRVVKPGGTIAAYVWDYAGEMQLMRYFWNAVTELFPDGADHDEGNQFPICKPDALAELFASEGLKEVATSALDAPTVFADFDDYWSPFLRGQGPAGAYCVSLSENDRGRLRRRLKDDLPINGDGTIDLIARAWAIRGTT